LLAADQAAESGPLFFRVRLENLTFTTPAEHRETGRYWNAESLPGYTIEGGLQPR